MSIKGNIRFRRNILIAVILISIVAVIFSTTATKNTKNNINVAPSSPADLKVNLLSEPYGIDGSNVSFSWVVNDVDSDEIQTAYQVIIATTLDKLNQNNGDVINTGKISTSESSYVKLNGLNLSANSLYYWKVKTWDKYDMVSPYSYAQAMTTSATWVSTDSIWVPQVSDFAFLRNEFNIADKNKIAKAIVSVTATSPESTRQYVYSLYLNGGFIGMGPARSANSTVQYNTYDVTDTLKNGTNAIGVLNYTTSGKQFLLQMTVYFKDGTSVVLLNSGRDRNKWKALGGTEIFGESNSLGTGYYTQAAENINANLFPYGWDQPTFDDSTWLTPIFATALNSDSLIPATVENENKFLVPISKVVDKGNGDYFIDIGQEVVGGLYLDVTSDSSQQITIYSGEQINSTNKVKYQMLTGNTYKEKWTLKSGHQVIQNYGMKTFRYVEITNSPVVITADNVKAIAIRQDFDNDASSFTSSDPALNDIYNFVKYSIKSTNQNLYVDSQSRERGSYEGDSLINMLSSYAVESNYALPRYSIEYLNYNRTWPAEYKLMSVIMSWYDYLYSGNLDSLKKNYKLLKSDKLYESLYDPTYNLLKRATSAENTTDSILVDWPSGERDGYDTADAAYNTVFNAVAYGAYEDLSKIALALGQYGDAIYYGNRADALKSAMIQYLYDPQKGAFCDGLKVDGTPINHYAQHASVFPLAFGVVDDPKMQNSVASYIGSNGIEGSVYEGFFLLQGLYNANAGDTAMDIMTSTQQRSWEHVINDLGATISTEAWDPKLKSNMTFSHPWGSAPASQITSGMFGIQPLTPGFDRFQIKFQPGNVKTAQIKTPIVKGTIEASYDTTNQKYIINTTETVPDNTKAMVYIPAIQVNYDTLLVDGKTVKAVRSGNYLVVELGSGKHEVSLSKR